MELSRINAAYLRPYDVTQLPQIEEAGPTSEAWRHATAFDSLLLSWAETTSALVVNRPGAMAANNSKPYQLSQIQKFFAVPETLITTDVAAALDFRKEHGTIVYKSLSGISSTQEWQTRHG